MEETNFTYAENLMADIRYSEINDDELTYQTKIQNALKEIELNFQIANTLRKEKNSLAHFIDDELQVERERLKRGLEEVANNDGFNGDERIEVAKQNFEDLEQNIENIEQTIEYYNQTSVPNILETLDAYEQLISHLRFE